MQPAEAATSQHIPAATRIRSRVRLLPAIRGRGISRAAARRTRQLTLHLVAELGGAAAVSPVQLLKVRRAAELILAGEQMRAASLRGERIDPLALVRLENLGARAVAALNLPPGKRRTDLDVRPTPYQAAADEGTP
jgi:hypothetical protein